MPRLFRPSSTASKDVYKRQLLGRLNGLDAVIFHDVGIDHRKYVAHLTPADARSVREVKTQALGANVGALLAHVVTEHRAKARVQEVRRRVIATGRLATKRIDGRHGDLARQHLTGHAPAVSEEATGDVLGVGDLESSSFGDNRSGVADLTTRFGVEPVSYTHLDVYKRQSFSTSR